MIDTKLVIETLNKIKAAGYDCFTSEAQLRDVFAIEIGKTNPNYIVMPEYTRRPLSGWALQEDLVHFDLLINDKETDEMVLFEFKYKTKKGDFVTKNGMYVELHEQSDTTNGRYALWKDIYRIESFVNSPYKSEENKIINRGYVIFITNNHSYYKAPEKNTLSYDFSIAEGKHKAATKSWNMSSGAKKTSIHKKNNQDLTITKDYEFKYPTYSIIADMNNSEHEFVQLVVEVN